MRPSAEDAALQRRRALPDLIGALAPHVDRAKDFRGFYGALLAGAESIGGPGSATAVKAREAIVAEMRKALGNPPPIDAEDGSWSPVISGRFQIGCFKNAGDNCQRDETLHWVQLSPYRLRRFSESLGEYHSFDKDHMKMEGYPDQWPVIQVSWYEATAYAAWRGASLASEAQWEVAARGGGPRGENRDYRKTAYFNGNLVADLERVGLYSGNLERVIGGADRRPLPTAESVAGAPNHPLGLVNIHGNVYSWTRDWYEAYPDEEQVDPGIPAATSLPAGRVVRGGSWDSAAPLVRLAFRLRFAPASRNDVVGLRLVLPQPIEH